MYFSLFIITSLGMFGICGTHAAHITNTLAPISNCDPFHTDFSPGDVSRPSDDAPFVGISPVGSYDVGVNGLQLYLDRPKGTIKTKDGENDRVAEGATVNSTFTLLYGKITMEFAGPAVPGAVTAAILISDQHDEIDVELLGGDPSHWQTNVFASSPQDKEPLWGVFGEIEDYSEKGAIDDMHSYTIDWNADRIAWSVDGAQVRTLHRADTQKNGGLHYPSHAARIQLGIWDASNPAGTAEWAKGPINWKTAPPRMTAFFKSVTVECPY